MGSPSQLQKKNESKDEEELKCDVINANRNCLRVLY